MTPSKTALLSTLSLPMALNLKMNKDQTTVCHLDRITSENKLQKEGKPEKNCYEKTNMIQGLPKTIKSSKVASHFSSSD